MKAFILDGYGSNDKVRFGEMAEPRTRDDDVLVQIHAASVNPVDAKIRDGQFKLILKHRTPFVLGNDLAGVVVRVGPQVRRFKPGDEVYACADQDRIGSFAEFIAVKESHLAIKPKTLSMQEAASIPLVGLTAWQVLIEKAKLTRGQKVLIHAGAGGVGTLAIQLAKRAGATVATTASAASFDLVRRLGADIVIDYKKDKFEDLLSGYDVVFDTQGGAVLQKSLRVLRPGGKVIGIAGPPDRDFASEAGLGWHLKAVMGVLSYRIKAKAKARGVSYSFHFMTPNGSQLHELGALIDAGAIRPVVDRVFPFAATKNALAYVEAGRAKGKVVIAVR